MRITDQEANRLQVLKAIRRAEPVARTELARLTSLPSQAISDVVTQLLRRDLLVEARAPASGRGRPRVLLQLNGDAARVVAACLHPDGRLVVEIADLSGNRLFGRAFKLHYGGPLNEIIARLGDCIDETIAASPWAEAGLHSVGLALPAIVDSLDGVLHWLPGYLAEPLPLANVLGDRLGLPVFVDSVANVLARAEHWFGRDRRVDDFTLVFVGLGIGLGQYQNGAVRIGDHGIGSAFAHVKVATDNGADCICGGRGCLLTVSSMSGVAARLAERTGHGAPNLERMQDFFENCVHEARAHDGVARDVFIRAGASLGTAVANYINLSDPSRVILLFLNPDFMEMVAAPFTAALDDNTLPLFRSRTAIELRPSEDTAFAMGTAALVLEQLYRSDHRSPRPS